MARVLVENFGHGALTGPFASMNGSPAIVAAKTGMSSGYCLELLDGDSVRLTLPSSMSDIYMAFKWWPSEVVYSYPCNILTFLNSNLTAMTQMNKENYSWPGRFYFVKGNNGTWLATNLWPYYDTQRAVLVEVRYKPATDATGVIVVRINGREVINYTGQNTDNAGPVTHIHMGWLSTASWKSHFCLGDLIIDDAAFPGLSYTTSMNPSAAGNSAQWSPSSGSNWDCVEEIPASLSNYIKEDTADQLDLYTMADPAFTPALGTVKNLSVCALNKMSGAPAANKVKLALRTNSTDYTSAAKTPGTDTVPTRSQEIWSTNPNTSAAWTESDLDSLEAGVKSST